MQTSTGRLERRGPSVLIASSEITPYAKTGGLGDVVGSLPDALARLGAHVSVVAPAYRSVLSGQYEIEDTALTFAVPVSNRKEVGRLLKTITPGGVPVYFVRSDRYYDRDYLYGTPDGDYPDNAERFVFFSRAILEVARRERPQILNANDWETALAITFLKNQPLLYPEIGDIRTAMTIHNLGYQGRFWGLDWHLLNLNRSLFHWRYLEFYGMINFLKGGIVSADAVTTVSPTYAEEIKTPEQGFGLDGVFRERASALTGILNGVDYRAWDPETDPLIVHTYGFQRLSGKALCKAHLQQRFALDRQADAPLISMVTRLTGQKGIDLVQQVLDALIDRGCQLIVLGSGDRDYQDWLGRMPSRFPGRVGVEIGFDESLAHSIIAGADFLLMPSRYEPGGLTQLYALKYGTIPIVRATGGLTDTVTEFDPQRKVGNGLVFHAYQRTELLAAVDRALEIFGHEGHRSALLRNAMIGDFSWERSARGYLDVYCKLLSAGAPASR